MASILFDISGRRQTDKLPDPAGKYDPYAQMWDTVAGAGTVEDGMEIFCGTSTNTTYSATTSTGKDNDSDDRGT